MINVTKPFLPKFEHYETYLREIWERAWLTNNGPLVNELENQLRLYLNNPNVLFCSNGTIALQMAIKALNLSGEIITTPFSYVATSNSILWENCKPIFCDIRIDDFCIDANAIENKITPKTSAILAVHVFGFPCDVEKIEQIARKYNLSIIYDGAHAFGVNYKGKSLLSYGDISTCSFHSTKLFHTIEGGATISSNTEVTNSLMLLRQFGHVGDDYFSIGINGKNSEFHAAMGLCNLPNIAEIINKRKLISITYDSFLKFDTGLTKPTSKLIFEYNYAYYPVVFSTEKKLIDCKNELMNNSINSRRYFFPSLNTLSFLEFQSCPNSESIANRILALPLFYELDEASILLISNIVNKYI